MERRFFVLFFGHVLNFFLKKIIFYYFPLTVFNLCINMLKANGYKEKQNDWMEG